MGDKLNIIKGNDPTMYRLVKTSQAVYKGLSNCLLLKANQIYPTSNNIKDMKLSKQIRLGYNELLLILRRHGILALKILSWDFVWDGSIQEH